MVRNSLIVDTTARIFADHADPRALRHDGGDAWKKGLWCALVDAGLPLVWVPEAQGGVGASFVEGLAALEAAGAAACAVPLAETMAGAWIVARAGLAVPQGRLALLPAGLRLDAAGRLFGVSTAIPFGASADLFVGIASDADGAARVVVVAPPGERDVSANHAGDDRCAVRFSGAVPLAAGALPAGIDRDGLLLVAAAGRAALMAGALAALVELSVSYAQERVAFGRPIGKFQAVQHNLARLAGEASAASVVSQAAGWALDRAGGNPGEALVDVASAKVRAGEAAGVGAAIAHQVHGAIGFTAEHVLHRFTHRLWSWRDEFGSESHWAERLGHAVAGAGADGFWGLLTGCPVPTVQAGGSWV